MNPVQPSPPTCLPWSGCRKLMLLSQHSVHCVTWSPGGWSDCSCHEETVSVVTELAGLYTPPSSASTPLLPAKQQVLSITSQYHHIGLSVNITHNTGLSLTISQYRLYYIS